MYFYIFLAFVNGLIIAFARVVNSRLGETKGALRSSFWNHLVGFLLLVGVVLFAFDFKFSVSITEIPATAFLGGLIGAVFVALNSFVMARIGVMRTILLVIGGQMIAASLIDLITNSIASFSMQLSGISLILAGIAVSRLKRATNCAELLD